MKVITLNDLENKISSLPYTHYCKGDMIKEFNKIRQHECMTLGVFISIHEEMERIKKEGMREVERYDTLKWILDLCEKEMSDQQKNTLIPLISFSEIIGGK